MRAQAHLLLQAPTFITSSPLNLDKPDNTKFSGNIICCRSTRYRSKWDANAEPTATGRSRFNYGDGFHADGDEDDAGDFSAKQRVWWSDNESDFDFDFDNAWEIDEEDGFGIFKIFTAFGWMFPAIAISLLLGTGPNAFFMALAVPLGQTVLSLAFDKVWGRTSNKRKYRPKTKGKRKPFARAANYNKTSKEENEAGKGRGSYHSWVATDGGSYGKGNKNSPRFGGWDELDKKGGNNRSVKSPPGQIKNELPKQQKKGKPSKIGRIRDTPLLLRLLIAAFPFLGSWTKFLF